MYLGVSFTDFTAQLEDQDSQFLAIRFSHVCLKDQFLGIFVHAAYDRLSRQGLWTQLVRLSLLGLPVLVLGDFNMVLSGCEKKGGRPFNIGESMELSQCIQDADLVDVGFSGPSFTWCNNNRYGRARVLKRLDSLLIIYGISSRWISRSSTWGELSRITP